MSAFSSRVGCRGSHRLNSADHKRRCQDNYVQVIKALVLPRFEHTLDRTINNRHAVPELCFDGFDHWPIHLYDVIVQVPAA